jgi:hypothetical protein
MGRAYAAIHAHSAALGTNPPAGRSWNRRHTTRPPTEISANSDETVSDKLNKKAQSKLRDCAEQQNLPLPAAVQRGAARNHHGPAGTRTGTGGTPAEKVYRPVLCRLDHSDFSVNMKTREVINPSPSFLSLQQPRQHHQFTVPFRVRQSAHQSLPAKFCLQHQEHCRRCSSSLEPTLSREDASQTSSRKDGRWWSIDDVK